jgi:hypothetical protein
MAGENKNDKVTVVIKNILLDELEKAKLIEQNRKLFNEVKATLSRKYVTTFVETLSERHSSSVKVADECIYVYANEILHEYFYIKKNKKKNEYEEIRYDFETRVKEAAISNNSESIDLDAIFEEYLKKIRESEEYKKEVEKTLQKIEEEVKRKRSVIRYFGGGRVVLINGKEIRREGGENLNTLREFLSEIRQIDVAEVLREAIEKKDKTIEEKSKMIDEYREEVKMLKNLIQKVASDEKIKEIKEKEKQKEKQKEKESEEFSEKEIKVLLDLFEDDDYDESDDDDYDDDYDDY